MLRDNDKAGGTAQNLHQEIEVRMANRIPRIHLTIERPDRGDTADLGGEAALLAVFVAQLLALFAGNVYGLDEAAASSCSLGFALSFCVLSVLAAAFDVCLHHLFRKLGPACACAAVLVVGGCGLAACSFVPAGAGQTALAAAAGCALGLADAGIGLYLGITFSRMDVHGIMANTTVALGATAVLYTAASLLIPVTGLAVIATLLPLAYPVLLRTRVTDRLPDVTMRGEEYFHELQVERGTLMRRLATTFAAFGLVLGFLSNNVNLVFQDALEARVLAVSLAVMLVAVAVLAAAFARVTSGGVTFNHVFRFFVPLLALLVLPLAADGSMAVGASLCAPLFDAVLCVGLTWGFLSSIAQEYRLSPVFVFGVGTGSFALGCSLLVPLVRLGETFCTELMGPAVFDVIACLFCLVVVSSCFPRSVDIHAVVAKSFVPPQEAAGSGDAGAAQGEAGQAGGESAGGGAGGEEGRRKGRFMRRCDRVADTFLLSRRESDVLVLLAKGRNVNFIRESLGISEGTAKTHIHHVYRKLGVHSQQELIELVDSLPEE
jgi:DNA-binding CsgD family transcriptional regulator